MTRLATADCSFYAETAVYARAITARVDYARAMHAWYGRPYFLMKKKVPNHITIHITKRFFLFETIVVHQRSYAPLLQGLVLVTTVHTPLQLGF